MGRVGLVLAARPVTYALETEYLRLCAEPSDINEHLPTFVDLVKRLRAAHVIELGTRTGVSTIGWLWGLAATGGGLTSVDTDTRPDIGEWAHWRYIQGDDLSAVVFVQLDPADIVFIDTSHTYDQTLAELNLYRWLVKPGGVIVCHDTELAQPEDAPPRPLYPVRTAIETFVTDTGFEWTNHRNCFGLAVIEVR